MEKVSGGEALVQSLIRHSVDTIFGLPGVQTYAVFDALARNTGKIQGFYSRHEQGAAYMAFGYARSTGRPGVYCVVPGPGVLNSTGALCTAWGCNEPVLCVTGQVPSGFIGKRRGHLHELPNQLATMQTLTKWAARIDDVTTTPDVLDKAFREMLSGRRGPVSVEMPWDVMARKVEVPAGADPATPATAPLNFDEISAAAKLIAESKNPMIAVGSGALDASEEVLALAEMLDAPVTSNRSGRGIVSDDHPLGVNSVQGFELWDDIDLLIGIGSRLEVPYLRWCGPRQFTKRPERPNLIRIDIDPEEMTRMTPDAAVVADSKAAVAALVRQLETTIDKRSGRRDKIAQAKAAGDRKTDTIQPQAGFVRAIRAALPREGILVDEVCQPGYIALAAHPVYAPRTFISSGFQGTLGFGYATSLGVKAAHPDKPVVSMNGDGGFMFGLSELSTAAQHNLAVVAVVFNNHSYLNVRRDQKRLFDGRVVGSDLRTPNFADLAETFGVRGSRAETPAELQSQLAERLEADEPALIEVPVTKDAEVSPWGVLMPGVPSQA